MAARTGADRSRDCQLARLHWRAAELAATVALLGQLPPRTEPMPLQPPSKLSSYRTRPLSAGRTKDRVSGRELHSTGEGARHHRPDGFRQIVAGANACRRVAAGARQGPARWCHARPMVTGCARPTRRLSAAGCGIVSRNVAQISRVSRIADPRGGAWPRRRLRASTISSSICLKATIPRSAKRYRAFVWTGATDRACARALSRSVPGRA